MDFIVIAKFLNRSELWKTDDPSGVGDGKARYITEYVYGTKAMLLNDDRFFIKFFKKWIK